MRPPRRLSPRRSQSGMVLVVVMMVMVILTLLGVMLLLRGDANQLLASNERDIAACRQAAEAALRQGVRLAAPLYVQTSHFTGTLTSCNGPDCPLQNSDLAPSRIVDRPGYAFDNAWKNQLYIPSPNNARGNVYVSVYMRNNADDMLPAIPADQYKTDTDSVVTIVGEAEMTFKGDAPAADRSNVRVRKMVAADIVVASGTGGGGGSRGDSWHSGVSY